MKAIMDQPLANRWTGNPQPGSYFGLVALSQSNRLPVELALGPFGQPGLQASASFGLRPLQQFGDIRLEVKPGLGLRQAGLFQRRSDNLGFNRVTVGQQE